MNLNLKVRNHPQVPLHFAGERQELGTLTFDGLVVSTFSLQLLREAWGPGKTPSCPQKPRSFWSAA